MRAAGLAALGLVTGLVLGWTASLGAYIAYFSLTGAVDREGSAGMGVAFGIGPLVGLILGIALAVALPTRFRRRPPGP